MGLNHYNLIINILLYPPQEDNNYGYSWHNVYTVLQGGAGLNYITVSILSRNLTRQKGVIKINGKVNRFF